ncbi:hypothetical protein RSO01_48160 [Reyranella soli]|uniref:Uncharacterized protein n=1 Tax=Reyranella soli TaxID=1230389 RepID=A0A512NFC3_9HYPH|nr:hypothetical protein RSO01_48160 [Reyranella soli]
MRGDTHSLAERWIESTDHIAEREQAIWKAVERLKPSPNAARKAEPVNRPEGYSALNRVIDSLCSQGPGKSSKVSSAFRHGLTMHAGQVDLPVIVLDWNTTDTAEIELSRSGQDALQGPGKPPWVVGRQGPGDGGQVHVNRVR